MISNLIQETSQGFASLRGSPNELWKAYLLKFLDSYSYFSFSFVFTLYLSSDFGYSDVAAGTIYGIWGGLISVYGFFIGFIVDGLGVAVGLRWGFGICLLARILLFLTTSRAVMLLTVLVILPIGNCLGIPVLTIGVRRYTNQKNQGFAFGLFYVFMNLGAIVSGPAVDFFTIRMDDSNGDGKEFQEGQPWELTGYRWLILSGIIANAISFAISLTIREIKVEKDADEIEKTTDFSPVQEGAWSTIQQTMENKDFWRFLAVCIITINVRMLFRHLDATFPKYAVREFGGSFPKGTLYSLNPAIVIVMVPLLTAATTKVDPLKMILLGSYVSAVSVFWLVGSTSIWASVAFIATLSIGESIWSPRLNDYAMSIVPEGREGTYMALVSAPLFLAKLPVGFLGGALLEIYCPEEGPRNSKLMWLIIGLMTVASPILMTLTWNWIYVDRNLSGKEASVEESGAADGALETDSRYVEMSETEPPIQNASSPRL